MKHRTLTLVSLLAIAIVPLLVHAGAAAVDVPPGQGVSLTPALQSKVLTEADKTAIFTIQLVNPTTVPLTMSLRTTDFKALNQTGGLAFTGSDSKAVTQGNGLSSILRLDSRLVTIPPKESRNVIVKIDDVAMLAPGGHYAAVIAQVIPGSLPTNGNNLAIYQAVSSLIFLETAGQGTKKLELLPISIKNYVLSLPQSLNLSFKSAGNTQTVPRGVVTINRGDKEIQRGIVNQDSSLVLPDSTRLLQVPLNGDRNPLLPGVYTLNVQYRYDGSPVVQTFSKRFVYINVQMVIGVIVILILFVIIITRMQRYLKKRIAKSKKSSQSTEVTATKLVSTKLKKRIKIR